MGLTHQLLNLSLLLNFLTTALCSNILFNYANSNHNTITCIKDIAKQYFPCGTLIHFVNQDKDISDLVRTITNENCFDVVVKSPKKHSWLIPTDVYILNAEDVAEFQSIILELRRDILWSPESKFVLTVQKKDSNEISDIFKICTRFKIYNIILLTPADEKIFMYTYYAFNDGKCGHNADSISLGTCNEINETIDIFSYKRPTSLKNCRFQVIASEDIPNFIFNSSNFTIHKEHVLGLEQYLLQTIQTREGVTIDYEFTTENYGVVLSNGTATGILRHLQEDEADIIAGGFLLNRNRIEMFDFIGGYNFPTFSVFIPNVGSPIWQSIFREFSILTWILILITFCIVAIISFIINNSFSNSTDDRFMLFLSLWGCLCGNTSAKMWKYKKIKMIMICWLWFSFFINSFYSTALYSVITGKVHVKQNIKLDNLEELPFRPCLTESIRSYFLSTYNKNLPEGVEYPDCQNINTALKLIASGRDLYAIELEYTYLLQEFRYVDEEGIPKLDSIDFPNYDVLVFYVTRGFAFVDRIREYMSRMSQNGLMARHLQMILDQSKSAAMRRLKRFKKMRLPDLRIHFFILLLGYGISLVCLIYEINSKKNQQKD